MTPRVYYNDNEPFVVRWLRNLIAAGLIPAGDVDDRPIQEVQPQDVRGYDQCHFFAGIGGWAYALQLAGWGDRPVWTGSCPCQPFSGAGKRQGPSDVRHLWPTWYALIQECRPRTVFGEQVSGIAGLGWLDTVYDDMESAGYAVGSGTLEATGVGAPQRRPRIWFVADADYQGWEGTIRQRQSHSPRKEREAPCREPLRSARRHWPPGPRAVHQIPQLANGLPGVLGSCKAYGNAIVPQVAAAFIEAYLACSLPAPEDRPQ